MSLVTTVVFPETEMYDMDACSSREWDENDLLILRYTPCRPYRRTRLFPSMVSKDA
jgi:hypothetical protein